MRIGISDFAVVILKSASISRIEKEINLMTVELILGVAAGLIHIAAFLVYHRQMLRGLSRPNLATWTLWVFISTLNCISYIAMSKDIVKGILPIASTSACLVVFSSSLFKGKLSGLNIEDYVALILGFVSLFVWWAYHSATYANLLLQISIFISFVPTYRGAWKDANIEKPLPWFVWASAYILTITVVFLRWQDQYQDLVYPVNCFLLHGGVGILTLRKPKGGFENGGDY